MSYFDTASLDRFKLSHSDELGFDAHVLDEQVDEALSASDADLSSFKVNGDLHPYVFVNGMLNSRVRMRLLDIADDFVDTLSVDWVKPVDIILTGSLANYNWSKYSDFDVHVVYRFKDVDEKTEFVKDYFNAKKYEWNKNHDGLKIYGFPVEMYVQDFDELHASSGVYSLEDNKWLIKPDKNKLTPIGLEKYFIKEKALKFMGKIERLERESNDTDAHVQEETAVKVKKLLDVLKSLRKEGLEKSGEMSPYNIIYKLLRRNGYLDRLWRLKSSLYDKIKGL